MRRFFDGGRSALERDLRALAAAPRPEFVEELRGRIEGRTGRTAAWTRSIAPERRVRLGFAGAATIFVLAAGFAMGAPGYIKSAAAAAAHATSTAVRQSTGSSSSSMINCSANGVHCESLLADPSPGAGGTVFGGQTVTIVAMDEKPFTSSSPAVAQFDGTPIPVSISATSGQPANYVTSNKGSTSSAYQELLSVSLPLSLSSGSHHLLVTVYDGEGDVDQWNWSLVSGNGGSGGGGGSTFSQTLHYSMGPQAMEGDLKVAPGTTLQTGFDFSVPGTHSGFTAQISGAQVTFQATCASGPGGGTVVVTMPDQSLWVAANDSTWRPSGDQHNSSVYQGSVSVPDICHGGQVHLQTGGTFTATVLTSDYVNVNVRWHYRCGGTSGSWSGSDGGGQSEGGKQGGGGSGTTVTWTGLGSDNLSNGVCANPTQPQPDLNPPAGQEGWLFVLNGVSSTTGWTLTAHFSSNVTTVTQPTQTQASNLHFAVYTPIGVQLLDATATNPAVVQTNNFTLSHCGGATSSGGGGGGTGTCASSNESLLADPNPAAGMTVVPGQTMTIVAMDEKPFTSAPAPTAKLSTGQSLTVTTSPTSGQPQNYVNAQHGSVGAQYQEQLSFSLPATMPDGAYTVTVAAFDGDHDCDVWSWPVQVGAGGGGGGGGGGFVCGTKNESLLADPNPAANATVTPGQQMSIVAMDEKPFGGNSASAMLSTGESLPVTITPTSGQPQNYVNAKRGSTGAQYQEQLTFSLPATMPDGNYTVLVAAKDGDGDCDQWSWPIQVGSGGGGGSGGGQYGHGIPICHRVDGPPPGSISWVLMVVDQSMLATYAQHGDIIPAPDAGCPQGGGGGGNGGKQPKGEAILADPSPPAGSTVTPGQTMRIVAQDEKTFDTSTATAVLSTGQSLAITATPTSGQPGVPVNNYGKKAETQYQVFLSFTLPGTLAAGDYGVCVTAHDGDGDTDTWNWPIHVGAGSGSGVAPGSCGSSSSGSNAKTATVAKVQASDMSPQPGDSETFVVTMKGPGPGPGGGGTPTGIVSCADNGVVFDSDIVTNGVATCIEPSLTQLGDHNITVTFIPNDPNEWTVATDKNTKITVQGQDSHTTVSSSSSPAALGSTVTYTIAVTGDHGVPTGTVWLVDGVTPLGTPVTLNGAGMATITDNTLTLGAHQISAEYSGDANYEPSSAKINQSIVPVSAPTTTTLTSSKNPSNAGDQVTFTAKVTGSGGTPAGSIAFSIDGGSPTNVSVDPHGQAALTAVGLSAGSHTVQADFVPGSGWSPSGASVTQTVNKLASTTTLSGGGTVNVGAQVTFTAALKINGANAPSGTQVDFSVDSVSAGSSLTNATGQAQLTVSSFSAGTHTVTASYAGSATVASSSDSTTITASKLNSTTTLTVSSGSITYGDAVTFTATVKIGPANATSGAVTFNADGSPIGTANVTNGTASLTSTTVAPGTHAITAVYPDSASVNGSTSAPKNLSVVHPASTTTLTITPPSSTIGANETFKATVKLGAANANAGSVTFSVDGTPYGTPQPVVNGVATLSTATLPAGTHTIAATYPGSGVYSGSSDTGQVTVSKLVSTTQLTATPPSSNVGDSVTFKATVKIGPANVTTGSVTFTDGATTLATVPVSNGTASFTTSSLAAGSHSVVASYPDSATVAGSSATATETVNKIASTTTLSVSPPAPNVNQTVTFTATVKIGPANATSGTVTFTVDGVQLGSPVTVSNGTASASKSFPTKDKHTVVATYSGSASVATSSDSADVKAK